MQVSFVSTSPIPKMMTPLFLSLVFDRQSEDVHGRSWGGDRPWRRCPRPPSMTQQQKPQKNVISSHVALALSSKSRVWNQNDDILASLSSKSRVWNQNNVISRFIAEFLYAEDSSVWMDPGSTSHRWPTPRRSNDSTRGLYLGIDDVIVELI